MAHFIMVLRPTGSSGSSSGGSSEAVAVPQVLPGTELEQLHFNVGETGQPGITGTWALLHCQGCLHTFASCMAAHKA